MVYKVCQCLEAGRWFIKFVSDLRFIKFVSDLRQVGGFLWVLRCPPIKNTATTK